jgi:hypothetical protein
MPYTARVHGAPVARAASSPRRVWRFLAPWAFEAALVVGGIFLYQLTKLRAVADPATAFANARDVIELERALGLFHEAAIERLVLEHTTLMPALRWLYLHLHFPAILAFLLWLRWRHPARYPRIRNGFALAHLIALVVFVLYPCAPPRMFPEHGFVEILALPYEGTHNPYAAIPSMHYGYASLVGGGLVWLGTGWQRWLGALYLVLIMVVIVATAAHFIIDAPLGTLTVAAGLALAGAFRSERG